MKTLQREMLERELRARSGVSRAFQMFAMSAPREAPQQRNLFAVAPLGERAAAVCSHQRTGRDEQRNLAGEIEILCSSCGGYASVPPI